MKKIISMLLTLTLLCGVALAEGFNASREITVISREDGSGTRGAFVELFGVEVKNEAGVKIDMTYEDAVMTNSTSVCMTSVAGNRYAIGYISLGSLNETVKALSIDGAEATVENIQAGTYAIARPFLIAMKEEASDLAKDFAVYILSAEGQAVVYENGYIPVTNEETKAYAGSAVSGKLVVAGSSSVTPVMEKLAEGYRAVNPNAEVQVQQSDSTTGIMGAAEGVCDIGMASRALKESELATGLVAAVIATDGIAVIVNRENPISNLSAEQVRAVYTGEITAWSEIEE